MSHTQGPWASIENVIYSDDQFVARATKAADAPLIASAPELLGVLRDIVQQADFCGCDDISLSAARDLVEKLKDV